MAALFHDRRLGLRRLRRGVDSSMDKERAQHFEKLTLSYFLTLCMASAYAAGTGVLCGNLPSKIPIT